MKSFFSKLMLGTVLAATLFAQTAFADNATITVIHTNDTHAAVKDDGKSQIGFAKLGGYVEALRKTDKNVLVLDAGDMFQGLPFANLEKGHSVIPAANKVGYDAMTVGNHEFDFGAQNLLEIEKKLDFPMIAANVTKDGKSVFAPYIVKEVASARVGIIGIATPETAYKTHPDNVKGYKFGDIVASTQSAVDQLKKDEKADVIIVLTHLGLYEGDETSDLVAKGVTGIDLIIDGHSHTTLANGLEESGTLIVSTGSSMKNVGKVVLTLQDNKVVAKEATLLDYAALSEVEANQAIADAIAEVEATQKPMLEKVIGKTAVDLVGERSVVRTGESNLGQLATDAIIELTKADVALTNGGGIRTSIPAGDVTMGQMAAVFPFGNTIMVKEITGADLKLALEHGVREYPNELGGFPHTAGITFTLNAKAPVGSRISDLKVAGVAVQADKLYSVATNDFMAAGGDGYDMLKPYPIKAEYNTLMDTLLDYIQAKGTIKQVLVPRMSINEEEVAATGVQGVREFAQSRGFSVKYDAAKRIITIEKDAVAVVLNPAAKAYTGTNQGAVSSLAFANGHYSMDAAEIEAMLAA